MKKPPRQQTETDKFQRHYEGEKISTQVSPIEETKSKIPRTKNQYSIDEKYEVSCLAESALCTQKPLDLVLETDAM